MKEVFLLLLEDGLQYEAYLTEKARLEPHTLTVCCLSVNAISFCKKNNIPYILPDDCFTGEESNRYREQSEQRIKELVESLNAYYHKRIGARDGFLFDIGTYHYFMLYHFFGALHFRAFFLSKIIEKHGIDKVLIGREISDTINVRPFPVSQYTSCYFDLFMNSVHRDKLITIPVEKKITRQYKTLKTVVRGILSRIIRKFPVANEYLNHAQNKIPFKLGDRLLGRIKSEILLVGNAGPWKYVFSNARLKNMLGVISETDEVVITPDMAKDWFAEWFQWSDDFCGFNISALGHYEMTRVKILSNRFIDSHQKTVKLVKKQKALIYSVCPYASQQYLLSVAKHVGIPRVCFQHGEMSLYYPGLWNEASELVYCSHYFSYGEQVSSEKIKSASHIPGFTRAVSIGSPALDLLKNANNKEGETILYASSKYMNYAAGFVTRYCDMNVYENQLRLVNYFEEYLHHQPQAKVIWIHNQEHKTGQPIKTVKKVQIIREEKTFTDLLPAVNVVILDRPSTTSLEACMTNKPLFVLLANKNWYPVPKKLLRKRAVIAYSPRELLEAIDKYLITGYYPSDVKNREFVRAYGSHLDDGLSAQRAVEELFNIVDGSATHYSS